MGLFTDQIFTTRLCLDFPTTFESVSEFALGYPVKRVHRDDGCIILNVMYWNDGYCTKTYGYALFRRMIPHAASALSEKPAYSPYIFYRWGIWPYIVSADSSSVRSCAGIWSLISGRTTPE